MYGEHGLRPYGIEDTINILTDDKIEFRNHMSWYLSFTWEEEIFSCIDNEVDKWIKKHGIY